MNILTRGLGPKQSIISQGFGGILRWLKGWVTAFKTEVIDWALKLDPTKSAERTPPTVAFEFLPFVAEADTYSRNTVFYKEQILPLIDKDAMSAVILHNEVIKNFEKTAPVVIGVDYELGPYGVERLEFNIAVDCEDRDRVFDEVHEYFETPQL